jgi:hypothetical protein
MAIWPALLARGVAEDFMDLAATHEQDDISSREGLIKRFVHRIALDWWIEKRSFNGGSRELDGRGLRAGPLHQPTPTM